MFSAGTRAADLAKSLAVDLMSTNMMVADASLIIVYVNRALSEFFSAAEADIRKDLPSFSASRLVGQNIDLFHKSAQTQRRFLADLKQRHRATIQLGGRSFDLVATPLQDKSGRPAGVAVEWADATLRLHNVELAAQVAAAGKSQAVIEFNMDGNIITANENFLQAMGYSLGEIKGKHHSMFVEPAYRDGPAYREFWAKLNRGEYDASEYKRIGKGGKEVWILASYNPILDASGKPYKVVKFATDVTATKLRNADLAGQVAAIGKSQAVIEFNMDGSIITANDNFLRTLGYSLGEIKGKHHSTFVDAAERDSAAYREFWSKLNRGEYQSGEFRRIGKGGRDVWIQATYNPILDPNGKPYKVVKFATDTTAQVIARLQGEKVRGMMDQVAAGAEELNASVREISEAMTKSKDTATTAVNRVEAADQEAQRLSAAAESMRSIVQLIGDITGQINLLALNATIESARAGEAGRGFAVVAAEVKNLANQAKQATDKIELEIGNLNGISGDVVGALSSIRKAIQDVAEYVNSTAAAVEEQSAVTSEMSTSMQRAAAEAAAIGGKAA
jgi:methyl-accepting chemotaxis protein